MLPLERTSPGGYLQWNLVQLNWSSYHPLLERGFLLRDFAPKQFLVQHFFRFFVFFCCFVFLARFDHFTLPSVSDSFSSTHFAPKCHFCTVLHCFALFAIFLPFCHVACVNLPPTPLSGPDHEALGRMYTLRWNNSKTIQTAEFLNFFSRRDHWIRALRYI